jgi:hypothetical protein
MNLENESGDTMSKSDNEFIKYLRGDYPLSVVFWIFGIGVSIIFKIVDLALSKNSAFLLSNWVFVWPPITWIYAALTFVAIWNSAEKSQSKHGPGLAKGMVILWTLGLIVTISMTFQNWFNSSLETQISELNKMLPYKIDKITRLDRVGLNKNEAAYYYTILGDQKLNWDVVRTNLDSSVCNNWVDGAESVVYSYQNESGDTLQSIRYQSNQCLQK